MVGCFHKGKQRRTTASFVKLKLSKQSSWLHGISFKVSRKSSKGPFCYKVFYFMVDFFPICKKAASLNMVPAISFADSSCWRSRLCRCLSNEWSQAFQMPKVEMQTSYYKWSRPRWKQNLCMEQMSNCGYLKNSTNKQLVNARMINRVITENQLYPVLQSKGKLKMNWCWCLVEDEMKVRFKYIFNSICS